MKILEHNWGKNSFTLISYSLMYTMECINSYSSSMKNDLNSTVTMVFMPSRTQKVDHFPQLSENTKTSAVMRWIITRISDMYWRNTWVRVRGSGFDSWLLSHSSHENLGKSLSLYKFWLLHMKNGYIQLYSRPTGKLQYCLGIIQKWEA